MFTTHRLSLLPKLTEFGFAVYKRPWSSCIFTIIITLIITRIMIMIMIITRIMIMIMIMTIRIRIIRITIKK